MNWYERLKNFFYRPPRLHIYKRLILLFITAFFFSAAVWPGLEYGGKRVFGDAQMVGIGILLLFFSASYIGRSNWRGTVAGRALGYMAMAWALFTAWVSLSTWLGTGWFYGWVEVRIGVYGFVFLTVFNMCWTLWEIQSGRIARDSSAYEDTTTRKS